MMLPTTGLAVLLGEPHSYEVCDGCLRVPGTVRDVVVTAPDVLELEGCTLTATVIWSGHDLAAFAEVAGRPPFWLAVVADAPGCRRDDRIAWMRDHPSPRRLVAVGA